jgi:hypothetical protein
MKKKLSTLTVVALFVLPISLPVAHSATKAGAKCTKVGVKSVVGNKTLTCIKSGKKLVWNKGVVTPTVEPVVTSKVEPFVAWSNKFEVNSLVRSALDSTDSYAGIVRPNNSYDIAIENSVREPDRKWIGQMLDYSNGFFSKIDRKKPKVFLGNSHDWSRDTMKNAGVWIGQLNQPYPCSDGTRDVYCAGYENIVLLIFMNPQQNWDIGRRSTPAHETFHIVQNALLGYNPETIGPGYPGAIPRWLLEGSANYFGYYVVEKLGLASYENGRNNQVRFNSEYRNIKPLSTYDNYESNPYGIGQAATEYIIASVGFESLLNIFKFTGTEGTFLAGFKKATGIELSEFYSKFESARSSMQIGQ